MQRIRVAVFALRGCAFASARAAGLPVGVPAGLLVNLPASFPGRKSMSTTINDETDSRSVREVLEAWQARSPLFSRPGFLIRRMHQIHGFLFAEETAQFDVTPVQYSLLTALDALGEIDQNSLAIEIGLERSSVAEVMPRLEGRGLIERRQADYDRRVKLVKLTRQGKRLVAKMAPAVQRAHDRTIEHLPPDERDLFMLQMIRLVEANNENSVVPFRLPQD
jgi:DNA-binding MarR family transcriptional regulator